MELHPLLPGVLIVLTSLVRAEAQVRIQTGRCSHGTVTRNRRLGALSAVAGLFYPYAFGADDWLQWASWINAGCSVVGAFAIRLSRPNPTSSSVQKEQQR